MQEIKSILVAVSNEFGSDQLTSALKFGLSLAEGSKARVSVQAAAVKLEVSSAWIGGLGADLLRSEDRRLSSLASDAITLAQRRAEESGITCEAMSPHLRYEDMLESFQVQARTHDLTVVDAAAEPISLDRGLMEALLMNSGKPMVIVPQGVDKFSCDRVMIAWDGSARAARACADAMPFLKRAAEVEIVTAMHDKDVPPGASGRHLASFLGYHGVTASTTELQPLAGGAAETLRCYAQSTGADLIVMGGYVHSRLREMIFGGVTQSLLRQCPIPILMSY